MKNNRLNIVLVLIIFLFFLIYLPNHALALGDDVNIMGSLLLFAIILIVFSLINRERVLSYFKINETLSVLKEIRDLLRDSSAISKENDTGNDTGACNNIKQDK